MVSEVSECRVGWKLVLTQFCEGVRVTGGVSVSWTSRNGAAPDLGSDLKIGQIVRLWNLGRGGSLSLGERTPRQNDASAVGGREGVGTGLVCGAGSSPRT